VKNNLLITICFFVFVFLSGNNAYGQTDRFSILEQRLLDVAQNVPGLNQKVETSISNISLQEFLRGIATTHNLNFNVDPNLTQKITVYFSNETITNLLIYLCKQYNLDLSFTGTIITIKPYQDPLLLLPPPPKALNISFNPSDQTITLDLQNDSLLSVAKRITQLTNVNVVVLPELFSKRVTGYVQGLTVGGAIEKVAMTNSFKLNKTNDNVYLLEPLKSNEQIVTRPNLSNANYSVQSVSQNGGGASSINIMQNNEGKKMISLNVVNAPIREVLKNISEQSGISYFVYSELNGNTTANVSNLEFDRVLELILQGSNYTFSQSDGVYMIGNRQDEGLRSHKLVQLKLRSVDSLLAVIPQEMKKGVEIKEFKELNSFLISGSLPQIKEIEAFVKELDRTVPMVMIEVILMDVNKSKTIETGIRIGVSDSIQSGGTLLGGLDYTFSSRDINRFVSQIGLNNIFNIGRVTPNFYASLKALEQNANIDLRQTPKLSTLNGHMANLSIGSTRYYAVTTQNVLGSLNPQTVVTTQFYPVEANLAISVLPFVSGDNQVTLTVDINISDFIGTTSINQPPPSASSRFKSIIRVKNEEMVVLGGIERNEKRDEGSGTPFLSRIPIIKWLFSTRSRTNSKTVSVVFIKPTIIF